MYTSYLGGHLAHPSIVYDLPYGPLVTVFSTHPILVFIIVDICSSGQKLFTSLYMSMVGSVHQCSHPMLVYIICICIGGLL